jgi:hypothetical protein
MKQECREGTEHGPASSLMHMCTPYTEEKRRKWSCSFQKEDIHKEYGNISATLKLQVVSLGRSQLELKKKANLAL